MPNQIRFPDKLIKVLTKAEIDSSEIPQGIQVINAHLVWPYTKGGNKVAAVIDTGVDLNHPDLKNNIIDAVSLIDDDPHDGHGHGTHVAGTIAGVANGAGVVGVAPEAKILSIKCIPASGQGNNLPIPEAIEFAKKWRGKNGERVRVDNLSLGTGNTPKLYKAIKDSVMSGILAVCASGNDGDGDAQTAEYNFPGYYQESTEVGALDSYNNVMATFSNSNYQIDFVAPGVRVKSCYLNGQYAEWSGTSMSTPHVVGAALLIIDGFEKIMGREITEAEIFYHLSRRVRDLGFDKRLQGMGVIDMSLHLDEFVNGFPEMPPQSEVYLLISSGVQLAAYEVQSEAEQALYEYVTESGWTRSGHIERLSDRKIVYSLGPSDKKIVYPKMSITGKAIATAEQMELYLHSIVEDAPYYAHLFLQEGAAENIRGDLAYAHSVMITFFFRFDKGREAGAFNFGMLGDDPTKVSFPDARTGARAFIQHLKAGANKEELNNPVVDPFFNQVPRGSRPTLESLSGTWHVPGYDPKIFSSLSEAIRNKNAYHHWIIQRYEKILNTYIPQGYTAPNPFPESKKSYPYKGKFEITYPFGIKDSRYDAGYHCGVDLKGLDDKTIVPINNGPVVAITSGDAYGNKVVQKLPDGRYVFYSHFSNVLVKVGDNLKSGATPIGIEGATGNVTGPHLDIRISKYPYHTDSIADFYSVPEYLGFPNEDELIIGEEDKQMQVAVVYWSLRDFSAMFMVSNAHGGCGTFCRNEKADNIHPDAENAKLMIVIGGPEVNHRPNVINLCGKGAPETQILAAQHVQSLRK